MPLDTNHIQNICDTLEFVYSQYIVLEELSKHGEDLPDNVGKVLMTSVARSFLQNLSNLVDDTQHIHGRNLSIRWLRHPDERYADLIEKLRQYRNKNFSHLDADVAAEFDGFVGEHPISPEETKELLEHLIEIVEQEGNVVFGPRDELARQYREELYAILNH